MKKTLAGLVVLAAVAMPSSAMAADCEDGAVVFNGKQTLWPPNHKYSDYSVTAFNSGPEPEVKLTLTGTSSQWLYDSEDNPVDEWNGAGHTSFLEDIKPNPASGVGGDEVTVNQAARAERSGRILAGRTYTITALAEYGQTVGSSFLSARNCTEEFTIFVPHDQRA